MTTIFACHKTGVMVCDSKMTMGDEHVPATKIHRLGHELIGFSGYPVEANRWLEWYATGRNGPAPKIRNCNGIVLNEDGVFFVDAENGIVLIERGFHGIGSGGGFAVAAYMAGADARQAVKIACEVDAHSGGRIITKKLKG